MFSPRYKVFYYANYAAEAAAAECKAALGSHSPSCRLLPSGRHAHTKSLWRPETGWANALRQTDIMLFDGFGVRKRYVFRLIAQKVRR